MRSTNRSEPELGAVADAELRKQSKEVQRSSRASLGWPYYARILLARGGTLIVSLYLISGVGARGNLHLLAELALFVRNQHRPCHGRLLDRV
eukprot:1458011-Amphidinium_carterae.1